MKIGEKIKSLRQSNNLTQKELAEKLNVSSQAISNWEREKGYPDIANIIQLSDLFSISLDTLIKEDLDFKEILLEDKADRHVDIFMSILVFLIALFILLFSIYKMITTHFTGSYVFGLAVGTLGVLDFGKRIYMRLFSK
ncbi:helix-turn-helix domain-containing protein [Vagococcus fluvialis]|uniref:Transcriptional regulator, XRE family n=1 Tax=Vagococcus fluvialis bH819 TaxID=1255619 RepID=A0A1X6WTM2_9ENTE|nr:helix-turn-helix transcriptional regulator [Vagococcus fluvialis]SLM86966.1 Transcriptional regulator, XRE family [Vagococcus fluvialis bH819]